MTTRRILTPTASLLPLLLLASAGCSSSTTTTSIGHTKPAAKPQAPESTAALGAPITKGALRITMDGPVTAKKDGDNGPGLMVAFNVTMTNTATSGDVQGPGGFMVRCDADRDAKNNTFGNYWSTTTAADKTISAGQTVTGTAVVPWLQWNSTVRCTGPTTIEAQWPTVGYLAWTLPADVVEKVNVAGGV